MTVWQPVESPPLTDEPTPREYWPTFSVGDRVRVRLSGECQSHGFGEVTPGVVEDHQHPDVFQGGEGIVGPCPIWGKHPCPCYEDHPIVIRDVLGPDGLRRWGHFAAIELEPL